MKTNARILFWIIIFLSPNLACADQWSQRVQASDRYGSQSSEFMAVTVDDVREDGTLFFTNGWKMKVPRKITDDFFRLRGKEVLLYIRGGMPRLDQEGRIVGSFLALGGEVPDDRVSSMTEAAVAQAAARAEVSAMTLSPPAGIAYAAPVAMPAATEQKAVSSMLVLKNGGMIKMRAGLKDAVVRDQRQLLVYQKEGHMPGAGASRSGGSFLIQETALAEKS